jgi:hypothetical protein
MLIVGRQAVGESFNPTADQVTLLYYYDWFVNWYNSDGGYKKQFFIGMDNVPITNIDFEKNKKICGAGKIKMAFLNFPVDADDYIEIYYQNTLLYRAIVDNSIDPKGGDIKLIPYSQRFGELLLNDTFTDATIESIVESIIEDNQTNTGVGYNSVFVDTNESTIYSYNFNYTSIKDALQQVLEKLDDREWGVLPSNTFTIYANNSTLDAILTDEVERAYIKVTRKKNLERVKETRRQVFKKNAAGQKTRVGQVGYDTSSGTYPTLSVENLVRRKEKTYDVSEDNLSSTAALQIAYEDLKKIATYGETIKIKDLDISKYNLDIGDYVKVIDGYELVLETILDCESVTNWTNATLDNDNYVEGSGSIQSASGYDPTTSIITYDFGEIKRFINPDFLQFMIRSTSETGQVLEYSFSNNSSTLWSTTTPIYVNSAAVWQLIQGDCSSSFRYFALRYSDTITLSQRYDKNVGQMVLSGTFADTPSPVSFNIDRMQVYHYTKNEYTGNVVQLNYKIDKFGSHVDVTLNDYDEQVGEDVFSIEKALEKIDTIQKN